MNCLAKHIELLLLDNDCIIVPRLGGFVAHHSPAIVSKEDESFLPPCRTLGFNPTLKINDGILAESYMNYYGVNFVEATKCIDRDVDELLSTLHEEGKVELPNIGELRYNIHGVYEFTPYDNKLMSPDTYGLDTLPMKELASNAAQLFEQNIELKQEEEDKKQKTYVIRLNRTFVRSTIAAASIILLLVFPLPINKRGQSTSSNRAQILPEELINELKSNSTASTDSNATKKTTTVLPKITTKPESFEHQSATKAEERPYQLIVASCISKKKAAELTEKLKKEGYADAMVLKSSKMVRVRIAACTTENEAFNLMNKLIKSTEYNNIWVLKSHQTFANE